MVPLLLRRFFPYSFENPPKLFSGNLRCPIFTSASPLSSASPWTTKFRSCLNWKAANSGLVAIDLENKGGSVSGIRPPLAPRPLP